MYQDSASLRFCITLVSGEPLHSLFSVAPLKCVLAALFVFGCSRTSGPDIFCSDPIYDAGAVMLSEGSAIVEHFFQIENRGNQSLELISARASCSCVSADLPITIPPGRTVPLKMNYKVTSLDRERKDVTILITTNDPKNPIFKLLFSAKAAASAYTVPHTLDFGAIGSGSTKEATLKVVNRASKISREFIKTIGKTLPAGMTVGKVVQHRETTLDKNGNPEYLYYADVTIELDGDLLGSSDSAYCEILLSNGEVLKVPIRWQLKDEPKGFQLETYIFRPSADTSSSVAKITYWRNVGELVQNVAVSGDGFSLKNVDESSDAISIEIACSFDGKKPGPSGLVTVASQTGNATLVLIRDYSSFSK